MRGKAASVTVPLSGTGITPAYAGKREEGIQEHNHHEDHPRLCGEKVRRSMAARLLAGSPPPMRGKGSMVEITCCKAGITPAYAGKSHIQKTSNAEKWDHPRLCGEKTALVLC